ncbi:MAG: TrkH family potassium uptake protein [Muribaculaceae bacterium]|nr:TrkH family potassium uptake protein [Muribaculaceae bacterium]
MAHTLRHINFAIVFRVVGWLLGIEALFMLMAAAVGLCYDESDSFSFLAGAGITLMAGALLSFGLRRTSRDMGKYEAFLLTALVWIVFSLFSTIPLMLCRQPMTFTDAFFESMSGFTTTGCTVAPSVEALSHTVNFWRCLIEWIGGMGIILFTLAVIPMLNHSGGMQMFNAEVTGITHEKLRPRVSQTAKGLWSVYFILTAALIGLLCLSPMNLFDSACHAFSTMSTGGFSTFNDSLAHIDSTYVNVVVLVFMFLGGTSFALIYKFLHGDRKPLYKNSVFRVYAGTVVGAYILIAGTILITGQYTGWESVTVDPLFQVISAISSTGFMVCDIEPWGGFAIALLFILMFSGACAGSTSGGAKIDRMIVLAKYSSNEIYRCLHPNTICSVRLGGKIMSPDVVSKVIAFICLYMLVMIVGGLLLTAFGMPLLSAFHTSFSCVSNTSYGDGYQLIPDAGKWCMTLLMLAGRLEIYSILILFSRTFWTK